MSIHPFLRVLVVLCLPQAVPAAVASAPLNQAEDLEEITVQGKKLSRLRKELVQTEDKIYKLMNELNTNDDFDIHCTREAPLGTRISQRICKPEFYADAEAEQAQGMLNGYYAPSPQLVALQRSEEYRSTLLKVINGSPALRKLIRERQKQEQDYIKTRKERFKGRWILFE